MRPTHLRGLLVRLAVYEQDLSNPSRFTVCEAYMPVNACQCVLFWRPEAINDSTFSMIEVRKIYRGKPIRLFRWFGWPSFGIRHCMPTAAVSVNLSKEQTKPPTLNDYESLEWRKLDLGPWREFWRPMYFEPPYGPLRNDASGLLSLVTQVQRTMAEVPSWFEYVMPPPRVYTPLVERSHLFECSSAAYEDVEESFFTRSALILGGEPRLLHKSVDPSSVQFHEHRNSDGTVDRWMTAIESVVYDFSSVKLVEIHNFIMSGVLQYTREQVAAAKRAAILGGYQGPLDQDPPDANVESFNCE